MHSNPFPLSYTSKEAKLKFCFNKLLLISSFLVKLPKNIDKKTITKFIRRKKTICLAYFIIKFFEPPEA